LAVVRPSQHLETQVFKPLLNNHLHTELREKFFVYAIAISFIVSFAALLLSASSRFAWALVLAACSGLGVQFASTGWNAFPAIGYLRYAMLVAFLAVLVIEFANGVQASSLPSEDVSLVRPSKDDK
jgi:hypothetical protein